MATSAGAAHIQGFHRPRNRHQRQTEGVEPKQHRVARLNQGSDEVHDDGGDETRGHVDRILNPEDGDSQNQIAHRAAADARDDGEPYKPHHVHAFARCHQRARHRKHDGCEDIEEMH